MQKQDEADKEAGQKEELNAILEILSSQMGTHQETSR